MPAGLGRRAFLKATGALGLLALVPARRLQALVASVPGPGQAGRFLTAHELDTLRAVTARFVPGPPDDPDPGALEAGVAEAIDLLLAAFTLDPPLIHAGGRSRTAPARRTTTSRTSCRSTRTPRSAGASGSKAAKVSRRASSPVR